MSDGEAVLLTQRIHHLLEMVATVLGRWPGWSIYGGDFLFVALGTVVPSTLVGVFPMFPPFSVGLASLSWALSLAENGSHCVLPVSELGRYVEEVGGHHWSPPSELVDKGLVGGVVGEGTHHIGVGGVGEFVPFLREPLYVVPKALTALMGAPLEVPGAPGMLVGALKILDEGLP